MRAIGGYLLGLVEAVWRTVNSGGCTWGLLAERLYRSRPPSYTRPLVFEIFEFFAIATGIFTTKTVNLV